MTINAEENSKSVGSSEADSSISEVDISMSRELTLESAEYFSKDGELVVASSDVLELVAEFDEFFSEVVKILLSFKQHWADHIIHVDVFSQK